MGTSRTDVSLTDLAPEVGDLSAGLGIPALPLFPLTLARLVALPPPTRGAQILVPTVHFAPRRSS
jgi:hypothetical protein